MTWARPDLLWLLLLVPSVLLLVVALERRRRRLVRLLAASEVLPTLLSPRVDAARAAQAALAVVAMLGITLAAAGPRLGFEWQQQKVEGVSIVVVLDVSRSMDAQDVSPSRIELARREILDLLSLLRGDAVGLVIFAAGPYVRIPLTVDYDTFAWAVKESSTDTIRAQGSALSGALDAAGGLLAKAEGAGKAIVVVSDGEGHDEASAVDASLAKLREEGVRVYALGIGEPEGAPIPLAEGGFKKDASGNVVLSKLDEDALRRLAAATGGAYVRAVPSDDDVRALYQDEIRGKLDAAERGVRREKLWHERFQWPLGVALVALVAGSLLGIGRRAPTAAALLLAVALAPREAWAGTAEDGLAALRGQEWSRAAELLGQARVEDPGNVTVAQGLAQALYRVGRYREAEQLFETLATQDDRNRAVHLYNAGNAAYRGGRLGDALEDFRGAVKADPKLEPAQKNATAVEREIAARTQPPPPKQDDQGSGEGQEGEQQEGQQADAQQGEQQEGQEGEQQQAQPGEQQAQEGQQQPGEQGPRQDPGEDGQAEDGEQQGAPGSDDEGRREGSPTDPNADGEPEGEGEGALTSEGDTDGEPVAGEGGGESSSGEMTREQAARLVDSVQDGKPRVVVGGRGSQEDW